MKGMYMGAQNVNYLYDNQVTPEELDLITKELLKTFEGLLYNNLRKKIQGCMEKALSVHVAEGDLITISYDLKTNRGQIDAILGNIRKNKKKK
jgi:hypothetical protein